MKSERAPQWLADFQERFTAMLRTPLARSTGTLSVAPFHYDAALSRAALPGRDLTSRERLAIYNRQYWLRLFGLLQSAFPLTTRLLGHWLFNDHAARFFTAHPPREWNIDRAPNGFENFLTASLAEPSIAIEASRTTVERDAVLEAAQIDSAWRRVFLAAEATPYRPSAADATRLLRGRLRPSHTWALLEEHWPLVELRRMLVGDPAEDAVALPPKLPHAQSWALVRKGTGIGQLSLDRKEAQLFALLCGFPVGEALARLEEGCSDEERRQLPANAQRWLARSVELDFWTRLDE